MRFRKSLAIGSATVILAAAAFIPAVHGSSEGPDGGGGAYVDSEHSQAAIESYIGANGGTPEQAEVALDDQLRAVTFLNKLQYTEGEDAATWFSHEGGQQVLNVRSEQAHLVAQIEKFAPWLEVTTLNVITGPAVLEKSFEERTKLIMSLEPVLGDYIQGQYIDTPTHSVIVHVLDEIPDPNTPGLAELTRALADIGIPITYVIVDGPPMDAPGPVEDVSTAWERARQT